MILSAGDENRIALGARRYIGESVVVGFLSDATEAIPASHQCASLFPLVPVSTSLLSYVRGS